MQFDLTRFLMAMLELFLECREDGISASAHDLVKNRPAVRLAVRKELRRQARKQGANRIERRRFAKDNMEMALQALETEVERNFAE